MLNEVPVSSFWYRYTFPRLNHHGTRPAPNHPTSSYGTLWFDEPREALIPDLDVVNTNNYRRSSRAGNPIDTRPSQVCLTLENYKPSPWLHEAVDMSYIPEELQRLFTRTWTNPSISKQDCSPCSLAHSVCPPRAEGL